MGGRGSRRATMQKQLVTIIVNGQPRQLSRQTTIAQLLAELDIPSRGLAVELNTEIVPRTRHSEQRLADGDRLEIVSLVGGG
jgi:sulfur carrier protein